MAKDLDRAIELQLDLQRVTASLQSDALKILRKLERELVGITASTEWRRARVEKQIREVKATIADYYEQVGAESIASNARVANVTAKSTAIGIGTGAVLPTAEALSAIASDVIVQGAPQAAWWAKQSADTAFKFGAAVRQGLAASETNQQIVRRVRDVMEVSKANAASLVQTSVASVSNEARMEAFRQNESVIEVYRAVATLDSHTCMQCAPLDGLSWETDGTPIEHSYPMPTYPLHYNCRCLLIGRVTREEPGGKRAATDGPVSAKTKFSDWLETQSKEKQEQILGPGRADLYRSGKITLADLTSGTGRPLTLAQLESKYN